MMPGPDQVIACPHCKALARHVTALSGNSFGTRVWSDGKRVSPMMPRIPVVATCHHCARCYWLDDAQRLGTVPSMQRDAPPADPAWTVAPFVVEPSEAQYFDAIQTGLATNPQKARDLRMLAWWRGNDTRRESGAGKDKGLSSAAQDNIRALMPLLDGADLIDQLLKVEMLRELGEFAAAIEALHAIASTGYENVVQMQRDACGMQDSGLREIV